LMKDFFTVTSLERVFDLLPQFPLVETEPLPIEAAQGRILAGEIRAEEDIPGFARSTMDGYAVRAASTFGASEANPAYLTLSGMVAMGESPRTPPLPLGHAMRISTGGMLPPGADSVVMLEYAAEIDATTLEIAKSVAPGTHVILKGEDVEKGRTMLLPGIKLRPQEIGLLAGLGIREVSVYRQPVVAILSTGDEIVPIDAVPGPAEVRDMNSYSIGSQILEAGAVPLKMGIVRDNFEALRQTCQTALERSDMVILSGGSSVGMRDLTIEVLESLADSQILVHGIPISPGKPTILAKAGEKPIWGLPGHVTSAMVVFHRVVRPFIARISGMAPAAIFMERRICAKISRNIASAQGRTDFVRVRLKDEGDALWAEPILGKSGLIHTMVQADGLVEIDMNTEGLNKGAEVSVILL